MNKEEKYIKYFGIFIAIVLVVLLIYLCVRQLEEYQLQDDPKLKELRDIFTEFFNQPKKWQGALAILNNRNPMKEVNLYKGTKSFTINKEKVYLCCKDENNDYYSNNMLIYVLAHELSHVLSNSIGHTPEFYEIFDQLLVECVDAGIYDASIEIISDYESKCGTG
jgi:hypothetical protein